MAKKKKAHKKVHRTKSSGARKPERLPVAAAAATVAPATAPTVPAVPAGPAAASVAAASPVRA
ncbi:MAG TPA: hypothetical protein VMR75_02905, partial [Candidatus Saccharimonadales bacterium]|nr:hypothetical protein [Candidatus Saccharimonadales bacterium]